MKVPLVHGNHGGPLSGLEVMATAAGLTLRLFDNRRERAVQDLDAAEAEAFRAQVVALGALRVEAVGVVAFTPELFMDLPGTDPDGTARYLCLDANAAAQLGPYL